MALFVMVAGRLADSLMSLLAIVPGVLVGWFLRRRAVLPLAGVLAVAFTWVNLHAHGLTAVATPVAQGMILGPMFFAGWIWAGMALWLHRKSRPVSGGEV